MIKRRPRRVGGITLAEMEFVRQHVAKMHSLIVDDITFEGCYYQLLKKGRKIGVLSTDAMKMILSLRRLP